MGRRARLALIWVEGPDAASFLHGLLSNDVASLGPGGSTEALLLDAKGHVQAAMGVHRDAEDALTLVVAPADGRPPWPPALDRYHFSEDLEILGPEEAWALTVAGMPGPRRPRPFRGSCRGRFAWWWTTRPPPAPPCRGPRPRPRPSTRPASRPASPGWALTRARPRWCRRRRSRTGRYRSTKGCYLGRRRWRASSSAARRTARCAGCCWTAPAEPGAPVTAGGREAGRVTSVARTPDLGVIGLAILRREVAPGDEVEAGGVAGRVAGLPFARR